MSLIQIHLILQQQYLVIFQKKSVVRADVFNIVGQRVRTLYNGTMESGQQRFIWDAKDQAAGVYFVRVIAAGLGEGGKAYQRTEKVTLLK